MATEATVTSPIAAPACAWPSAHTWLLLRMWVCPRLVSGFLQATLGLLLVRLACHPLDPLPGEARFLPLFMLGPVAAVLFGPAGVWAAFAASLLGDFLGGTWSSLAWFRAGGEAAAAWHVFALWDVSFCRRCPGLVLQPTCRQALRFLALALPAGGIAVTWSALGCEWYGLHAFGYVAAIEGAQILVFGLLTAPILYRVAARDFAAHLGDWRACVRQEQRWAHWRPVGLLVATVVAVAAGPVTFLYSASWTADRDWLLPALGASAGGGVLELAVGLLALHLVVIAWPD